MHSKHNKKKLQATRCDNKIDQILQNGPEKQLAELHREHKVHQARQNADRQTVVTNFEEYKYR